MIMPNGDYNEVRQRHHLDAINYTASAFGRERHFKLMGWPLTASAQGGRRKSTTTGAIPSRALPHRTGRPAAIRLWISRRAHRLAGVERRHALDSGLGRRAARARRAMGRRSGAAGTPPRPARQDGDTRAAERQRVLQRIDFLHAPEQRNEASSPRGVKVCGLAAGGDSLERTRL